MAEDNTAAAVEETLEEAAEVAQESTVDAGEEPTPAEPASTADLHSDFAEMDDEYAERFQTEESATPKPEEPEPVAEAPVEATPVEEVPEVEESVEASPVPTSEELASRLAKMEEELAAARAAAEQPAQQETAAESQPSVDEAYANAFALARKDLTEQVYALRPEQADKMITEPEAVLPALAAQVHLNVLESVMSAVRDQLPAWITHTQQVTAQKQQIDEAFYTAWPQLREHAEAVDRNRAFYRQANPSISEEQLIKDVGAALYMSLGLVSPTADAPSDPAAKPSQVTPIHRPARGRGTSKARPKNEWTEMAADDEDFL